MTNHVSSQVSEFGEGRCPGHTDVVIESWDELIEKVGLRPGMWVGRPTFVRVASFIDGFDAARGDEVLSGFRRWLADQPSHRRYSNYVWQALVLDELFPDRRKYLDIPIDMTPQRDPDFEWPKPGPEPMWAEDLVYPDEDAQAVAHLFKRLREYLDIRAADDSAAGSR